MRILFLSLFFSIFSLAVAQDSLSLVPPEDPLSAELVYQGKRYLQQNRYLLALEAFDTVTDRPFSQSTTAAWYFSGLTLFEIGAYRQAVQRFDVLMHEHPRSRYSPEANYHRALILLSDSMEYRQSEGLDSLQMLAESALNPSLAKTAKDKLRQFAFYQASEEQLFHHLKKDNSDFRIVWVEAIVYRRYEQGGVREAREMYRRWKSRGGLASAFLDRLLDPRQENRYKNRSAIKLALFLPLNLDQIQESIPGDTLTVPSIPPASKLALEFYEGFDMAIREFGIESERSLKVKVFDSRRDSQTVREQLYELDFMYPDLLVGDIYNKQSSVLSEWAEHTGTPQIVPLSPSPDLIKGKEFVFLATPQIQQHGTAMAIHAHDSLRLNKVAVWTDGRSTTELIANAFIERFSSLGGEAIRIKVNPDYDSAKSEIPSLIRSLRFQQVEGMYIPILGQQEICGLIINHLAAEEIEMKIMGGPHWWKRYANIDRSLKELYQVDFTTSYFPDKSSEPYKAFWENYLQEYEMPPSEYAIQGYSLGTYLLHIVNYFRPDDMSLAEYIRNHPPFQALHLDYDFDHGQSNQFINIAGYRDGQLIKLNANKGLELIQVDNKE